MQIKQPTVCAALALLWCALMATLSFGAWAQAFPNRPLRIIYGYSAGSGPDVLSRRLAAEASKILGQPVIYENRTGANGRMGLQPMRDAPADGHFLNVVNDGNVISQPAQDPEFKFEPGRDYAPVSMLMQSPLALFARPDAGFRDMKSLVAHAKANPTKINWATTSGASEQFVTMRLLRDLGMDVTLIPTKGGAENSTATLGGHTDLFFSTTSQKSFVDQGKLNVLATTGKDRWKPFGNAPTFLEAGIPFTYSISIVLIAATNTPRDIVLRLNRAFAEAARAPDVVKNMDDLAYSPATHMSPEEIAAFIKSEVDVWVPLLRKTR